MRGHAQGLLGLRIGTGTQSFLPRLVDQDVFTNHRASQNSGAGKYTLSLDWRRCQVVLPSVIDTGREIIRAIFLGKQSTIIWHTVHSTHDII